MNFWGVKCINLNQIAARTSCKDTYSLLSLRENPHFTSEVHISLYILIISDITNVVYCERDIEVYLN